MINVNQNEFQICLSVCLKNVSNVRYSIIQWQMNDAYDYFVPILYFVQNQGKSLCLWSMTMKEKIKLNYKSLHLSNWLYAIWSMSATEKKNGREMNDTNNQIPFQLLNSVNPTRAD